jgi:hypothetical protein
MQPSTAPIPPSGHPNHTLITSLFADNQIKLKQAKDFAPSGPTTR